MSSDIVYHAFMSRWFVYIFIGFVYQHSGCILCQSISEETESRFNADEAGAVAGRFIQISGKEYRLAFKAGTPKLGDCALKMNDSVIQFCTETFGGEEVFIPVASTIVDVSRVQSSEDILTHVMGALGAGVGVLGLASVDVKVKVAVTTKTSKISLNLLSSYEVKNGMMTLHNARPLTPVGVEGVLFLSEIQLGGNELILVTIDFESESKKTEVEMAVKVKILFITITAKLRYIHETFKTNSAVRVQFISSWRPNLDKSFSFLDDQVIEEVKAVEELYIKGPSELKDMETSDERLHNSYIFGAWNQGPYSKNANLGTVNADMDFLKQQNAEISAVLNSISDLSKKMMSSEQRSNMLQLNGTLTTISEKLSKGLDTYHTLNTNDRNDLYDIYGTNLAPLHYERKLRAIFIPKL